MYKFTFECGCKIINGEDLEYCAIHAAAPALYEAAKKLGLYRSCAGALNFQLEKADDYIRELNLAVLLADGDPPHQG